MLFETKRNSRDIPLEVGDIIEYTCDMTGLTVRRLIVEGDTGYMCIRLDTMKQTLNRTSLEGVKSFYMHEMDFRIIKSKNLKIVEVS